jgi:hypothetical protein
LNDGKTEPGFRQGCGWQSLIPSTAKAVAGKALTLNLTNKSVFSGKSKGIRSYIKLRLIKISAEPDGY